MASNPSVSIGAKIREVGFHSVIYGFGSVAQSAVQFLLIPVLTATLATSQFGAYSLIQMASVIAGAVFYLGMTSALPRSYFDYEDEQDRRSVFTTAFLLLLTGAIAQVTVGSLGGRWISRALLQTDRYDVEIFWAFLGSALAFINQFFFTYLRFLRRSVASIVLSILALIATMGLSLVLLHRNPHDLSGPFRGITYGQALILAIFLLAHARHAFTKHLKTREIKLLLAFGLPAVTASLAGLSIDWTDRIFISRMLSISDVGIYSVGYKLGSAANAFLVTPFTQIWSPMMIEYRTHDNIGEFFSRIVSYYLLVSCFILVFTCLFVSDIVSLVAKSSEYSLAAPVVLLIMTGYLLNGMSNILGAGLIYERRIQRLGALYYLAAIANIGLNFWFIPRFGILGAAITSLITYTSVPLGIYWQSKRYFAIQFDRRRIWTLGAIVTPFLVFGIAIEPMHHHTILFRFELLAVGVLLIAAFATTASEKRQVAAVFCP